MTEWVYNSFVPLGKHLFHPLVGGGVLEVWPCCLNHIWVIPLQRRLTSGPPSAAHAWHWPCLASLQTLTHSHLESLTLFLILPTVGGVQGVLFCPEPLSLCIVLRVNTGVLAEPAVVPEHPAPSTGCQGPSPDSTSVSVPVMASTSSTGQHSLCASQENRFVLKKLASTL